MSDTGTTGQEVNRPARASGKDFGAGLTIFLIALYALIESVNMPYFEEGDRGILSSPGLTPGLLAACLLVMSVVLMVRAGRPSFAITLSRPKVETWRMLSVIGIIIIYIAFLKAVGYFVMTFVMMAAFQAIFARKHDLRYILIWCVGLSLAMTGALWVVFAKLFLIPMP